MSGWRAKDHKTLTFKTRIRMLSPYKVKSSRVDLWKKSQAGDILELSMQLEHTGGGYGGRRYALYIDVENLTRECSPESFAQNVFVRCMDKFDFEVIDDDGILSSD